MDQTDDAPIMIFDAHCLLCHGSVQFVLRHEKDATVHFAAHTSDIGRALAATHGYKAADLDRTFLLIQNGHALDRSEAALALCGYLRAPYRWLGLMRLVPRPLRNAVYSVIAKNRIRLFGRSDTCFAPHPDLRARFRDLETTKGAS